MAMPDRKRCPYCRRLFTADPRVKQRQKTCGRAACRQEHKSRYNQRWRRQHPDYFRGMYPQQRQAYGSRAAYKRQYRSRNPEYVRRNAAYVRDWRRRQRQRRAEESPTSCDLRLSLWGERTCVEITRVSHTSRDIFVSLCQAGEYPASGAASPTSFDGGAGGMALG